MGVFCRDCWKAFILSASGFMPPLAAVGGPPGGLRAALTLPRGCDEVVILETLAAGGISEEARASGGERRAFRLPIGDEAVSSGEVGGEWESSGACCSSGAAMMDAVEAACRR